MVEGTGNVALLTRRSPVKLSPQVQAKAQATSSHRVFLSNRLPAPTLRYETFDGKPKTASFGSRPILLTLWISWCDSSKSELKNWSERAGELKNANLDILALSVDGLDQGSSTTSVDARNLVERLSFPFRSGVATRESLNKLEIAESILFTASQGLSVPVSYLIDATGAIACIYRGPIDIDVLAGDVQNLEATSLERRNRAVPFTGRWVSPPRQLLMRAVSRLFQKQGYEDEAARYLKLDLEVLRQMRSKAISQDDKSRVDKQFAEASFRLGQAMVNEGDVQEAVNCFQQALRIHPRHVNSLINLGAIFAKSGKTQSGIALLEQAIKFEPNSVPARMNLSAALASAGQFEKAIPHYQYVLSIQPNRQQVNARLGRALIETSDLAKAVLYLEKAVSLRQDFAASLSLAWLRATAMDNTIRNGPRAAEIARRLLSSRPNDPLVHDLLAVAEAESGNFEAAREFAKKALDLLGDSKSGIRKKIQQRLKSFEADVPYRDTDGKYP